MSYVPSDIKPFLRRNLANGITLLGGLLCAPLLWIVISHRDWTLTIFSLLVAIFLTDFLDGKTARHFNTISPFGIAADRFRDKLVLFIMFGFLISDPRIDLLLKTVTLPVAVVEVLLLVLWFMGLYKGMDVSAGRSGKVKMFLLSVAILLCMLAIAAEEQFGLKASYFVEPFLLLMFATSLVFGLMSFWGHFVQYLSQLP